MLYVVRLNCCRDRLDRYNNAAREKLRLSELMTAEPCNRTSSRPYVAPADNVVRFALKQASKTKVDNAL